MSTPSEGTEDEAVTPPTPGACVAEKYELIRRIGSGGMGTVWEARHLFTHAHVAVKLLNPSFAQDADMIARFLREARAVTAIGHPNLVRVLDMGPSASGYYLAQELLHGGTLLAALNERGSYDVRTLWTLLRPIAEALDAAHQVGVVHRDIKPENIFLAVNPDGSVTPRLIDVGIAKTLAAGRAETLAAGRDESHRTAPNQTPGTPAYMAPEQCMGDPDLDARVDVWALGVVVHECLVGEHPFEGSTAASVMLAIVQGRAAPLANATRPVPGAVADAVRGAMTVDRAARHPTMRAFLDAMDAAVARDTPDGPGASPARASAPPAAPSCAVPATRPHSSLVAVQRLSAASGAPSPLRRVRWVLLALAAVALVAAAARALRAPAAPAVAAAPPPPVTRLVVPMPAVAPAEDAAVARPRSLLPSPPTAPAVRVRPSAVARPPAPRTLRTAPLGVQDDYE